MDNKSDEQVIIMEATIDATIKHYDEKRKKLTEELTSMIASMMDHIKDLKYSPNKKDSPKAHDTTTVVTAN